MSIGEVTENAENPVMNVNFLNREGNCYTFDNPDGEWSLQDIGRMLFDLHKKIDAITPPPKPEYSMWDWVQEEQRRLYKGKVPTSWGS